MFTLRRRNVSRLQDGSVQRGMQAVRGYHGITGNSRCAVLAFREWYRLQPAHFERPDVVPMFTMPDGRVLGRVEMQNDLRLAAIALKLPSENTGTHSFRVSCAT